MAEARARFEWDHTSTILAVIATIGSLGKHTYNPADFHPWARQKRAKVPISALRSLFAGGSSPFKRRRR